MMAKDELNAALREWVEVFMTRSHHDLMRYLKAADVSMAQFGTLMRLFKDDGCGVSEIASLLSVSNAAASQLVDKLVQQGLVARAEDVEDRRVRRLSLTARGRALLEGSLEARLAWMQDLPRQLPVAQRAAIVKALQDLVEAARAIREADHGENERA